MYPSNARCRHFPTLSVLRRHPSPSRQQFDGLLAIAEAVGIELEVDNSKRLAASLDRATREDDPYFNKLLRILSTRLVGSIRRHRTPHVPPIVYVLPRAWVPRGIAVGSYLWFLSLSGCIRKAAEYGNLCCFPLPTRRCLLNILQ